MKAEDLIPQAANLVNQLVKLVSGPKQFISKLNLEDDATFKSALLFFALTVIVTVMLEGFYIPGDSDFFELIKNTVIFHVLTLLISTGLVFLAWKIVGGLASYRQHTILACYFVGVGMIIWSASALLSKGYLKSMIEDKFDHGVRFINLLLVGSEKIHDPLYQDISQHPEITNALLIFAVGILLSFIWLVVSWGAYRTLNQRTHLRAAGAFMIFVILNIPVSWLLQTVQQSAGIILF